MGRNDLLGIPKLANSRLETNQNARVGEVALSPSVGVANPSTSTTPFDVPNAFVTIVTTGRPVFVGFTGDGSGNQASLYGDNNGSGSEFAPNVIIFRDGIEIARYQGVWNSGTEATIPISSVSCLDMPGPGTHTYKAQMYAGGAAAVKHVAVSWCRFFAVEL